MRAQQLDIKNTSDYYLRKASRGLTSAIEFRPDLGVSLATPVTTASGLDEHGLTTINVTALNRYKLVHACSMMLMDLRKFVLSLERAIEMEELAFESGNDQLGVYAKSNRQEAIDGMWALAAPVRPYSAVARW